MIARLVLLAALAASAEAAAAPRLHCHIDQADTSQDLQFGVSSDPYTAPSIAIGERFRFKAVMVGDGQRIEYIKLYTYYQARGQSVLLHEAKYLAPQAQAGTDPAALTGLVYLYSPSLGRELRYGCALREEAA